MLSSAGRILAIVRDEAADRIIELALLTETWPSSREPYFPVAGAWPAFLDFLEHWGQFAHMAISSACVYQIREDNPEVAAAACWGIFDQGHIASSREEMRGLSERPPIIVRICIIAQRPRRAVRTVQHGAFGLFAGQVVARVIQTERPRDIIVFLRAPLGHFDMDRFGASDIDQQLGGIVHQAGQVAVGRVSARHRGELVLVLSQDRQLAYP